VSPAPFGRRGARVTAREDVGAYVLLEVDDPAGPAPSAGQFFMLSAPGWGGGPDERPFLPRAFSAARVHQGRLQFLLEDIGPGTHLLARLAAGDEVLLTGPLGNGFTATRTARPSLLVGGGIGAAPLLIWQDELLAAGKSHLTLLGFRDAPHAEAAALFTNARVATDDGSSGHHGFVTDLLTDELDRDGAATIYACGPPGMLEAVRRIGVEREVETQLALESPMACGFGACFGCVVPLHDGGYSRVCVDGPVMEAGTLREVPAH
jgi:NAD(P)H-flavin reductase